MLLKRQLRGISLWSCTATLVTVMISAATWGAHPHLFFDSSDIPGLQSRISQEFYAQPFQEIVVDSRSTYGPGKAIDTVNPNRRYTQGILSHGGLWIVDPTRAALPNYQSTTRFFDYYFAVLDYSGWSNLFNDDPILPGYYLTALALGFDWHYNDFTPSQRTDIVNKLTARANYLVNTSTLLDIPVLLNDPSFGYNHTFKVLKNPFVMSMSGLGMVAYALEGDVPEPTRQVWLNKLQDCMNAWSSKVSPDGVSHESYSYHELMIYPFFSMLYARSRATGINQFNLFPYVSQHPIYSMYSWVPGGDRSFALGMPFGDSETGPPSDMITNAAIAARELAGAPDHRDQLANWQQWKDSSLNSNNNYARADSLHLFWADSSIAMKSPVDLGMPPFHFFPNRGVLVWRTGWDNQATYFAMICGPTIGGHQHPEAGNFIIYRGGAPFIAHHGYLDTRQTEYFNVLKVNNLGEWGDGMSDTTSAEPASHWASITSIVADEKFFNVFTNLRPAYRDTTLTALTREFVGFQDYYFVRDKGQASSSASFTNYLHAYRTTPPPLGDFDALDPDSDPTANPWSGSGGNYTITPRTSGPYTGSMTVKDLSPTAWSGSITNDVISFSSGSARRGSRLTRSRSGASVSSLMAYAFPAVGESLAKWPASDGDGFVLTDSIGTKAVCAWPNSGTISGTANLTMSGAMGGLELRDNLCWGRDITNLAYNGTTYFTATPSVTFFANVGSTSTLRLVSSATATVTLRHPSAVSAVSMNGVAMNPADWSWSGGTLTLTLAAQPGGALITTTGGATTTAGQGFLISSPNTDSQAGPALGQ